MLKIISIVLSLGVLFLFGACLPVEPIATEYSPLILHTDEIIIDTESVVTLSATPTPFPTETPIPLSVSIYPNLEQAREEGFQLLAGHPPFSVTFRSEVDGGKGALSISWDFDDDGTIDSSDQNPAPFVYESSGEYFVSLAVKDETGQVILRDQRIVVIGEPEYPDWCYGIVDHLNKPFGLYLSDDERVKGSNLIANAGIQAVRLDYPWTNIEPERSNDFVWGDYDEVTHVLKDAGLEVVAILGLTPKWASSGDTHSTDWTDWGFAPPQNPQDYADFVYRVVERYNSDVRYWEIWNEPNLNKYFRNPDPIIYSEMLKRAYYAAKYADPNAVVIAGSLANDESQYQSQFTWVAPELFLENMYEHGAKGHFDVLSRHPYNVGPNDQRGAFAHTRSQLEGIRSVLDSHGDSHIPIWITEYGVTRDVYSEDVQASFLTDSLAFLFENELADVVIWYNLRATNTGNTWQDGLGIVTNDLEPLPAYEAYSQFIRENPCP